MRRRHNFVRIIAKGTSLASFNLSQGRLALTLFAALVGGLGPSWGPKRGRSTEKWGTEWVQAPAFAAQTSGSIRTNQVTIPNAPGWLNERRVQKVTDKIQRALEWDIRRVSVTFYTDSEAFERVHRMGGAVLAVTRKSDQSIHIGPRVAEGNFDEIFGHELGHVIVFQKYKDSVPAWLEEGLANFAARPSTVDYRWLAQQRLKPVREMGHPFQGLKAQPGLPEPARYHYMASTALAEMLAAQCGMRDLLQLSTGKKLENYLATFCRIKDLDQSFSAWVKKKAGGTKI